MSFTDDGMQFLWCFQFNSHMYFKIGKSYKTHLLVFSFIRLTGWLRSSSLGCLFAELPTRALVMLMLLMVAHLGPVPSHCWEWNHLWELKTLNCGLFLGPAFCQPFSEVFIEILGHGLWSFPGILYLFYCYAAHPLHWGHGALAWLLPLRASLQSTTAGMYHRHLFFSGASSSLRKFWYYITTLTWTSFLSLPPTLRPSLIVSLRLARDRFNPKTIKAKQPNH